MKEDIFTKNWTQMFFRHFLRCWLKVKTVFICGIRDFFLQILFCFFLNNSCFKLENRFFVSLFACLFFVLLLMLFVEVKDSQLRFLFHLQARTIPKTATPNKKIRQLHKITSQPTLHIHNTFKGVKIRNKKISDNNLFNLSIRGSFCSLLIR